MKNIKFKIIILMTILIILSGIILANISIASNTELSVDLYSKGHISNLIKYQDTILESDFVVYENSGIEYPAYSLQQDLGGVTENNNYSVNADKLISNVMVWKAITNGYPYKTYAQLSCDNDEQAFMATQQAVYCIIYDRDVSSYTAINEEGEKCLGALNAIINNAKQSSDVKVVSSIAVKGIDAKWEIDKIDSKYVSMVYTIESEGPMSKYTVNLSGTLPEGIYISDEKNKKKTTFSNSEKFKVLIPITNLRENGDFTINVEGEVETKPILYGVSTDNTKQDYALTASIYEDGSGIQKIYYTKNLTKMTILKRDDATKKPLRGAQFEVLDKNKKAIYTELVTDKNGEITLENLLPGKYFIKEVKTLEKYTLYDKLIEVNIDLNEEARVILNTSEETVTVEYGGSKKEEKVGEAEKKSAVSPPVDNSTKVENNIKETTVKLPKTGF